MNTSQKINSVNDIFQVTINSSRLNALIHKIQKGIQSLKCNYQALQQNFLQNKASTNRKLISIEQQVLMHFKTTFDKFKIEIKAQIRQKQQTNINNELERQKSIKEIGYSIDTINDKITKNKDQFQQSVQNCIKQFSVEQFSLKRQIQKFQQKFSCLIFSLDQKLEQIQTENILTSQKVNFINQKIIKDQINDKNQMTPLFKKQNILFQQTIDTQKYKKHQGVEQLKDQQEKKCSKSIKKHITKKHEEKKKKKSVSSNYLFTLQYASISQKVNQLQKKISQNQQFQNTSPEGCFKVSREEMEQNFEKTGFFTRKGKNNMMKTYSYSKGQLLSSKKQEQQQESLDKTIDEFQELKDKLLQKTQRLQKDMQAKNKNNQQIFNHLKQRQTIIDQKFEVLNKKNHKNTSDLAQIRIKMLHLEKKFHNNSNNMSSINELQSQLSKLLKKFDKQIQAKINVEVFQLEKEKIINKLNIVQENIIQKVDKIEVKKAFNFLQDKIKQIILIIANDFNQDKVGAINRTPFKCLVCDKEKLKVQNSQQKSLNMCSTARNHQTLQKKDVKDNCQYYTRLLKSKVPRKKLRNNNYTSVTQMTEENEL